MKQFESKNLDKNIEFASLCRGCVQIYQILALLFFKNPLGSNFSCCSTLVKKQMRFSLPDELMVFLVPSLITRWRFWTLFITTAKEKTEVICLQFYNDITKVLQFGDFYQSLLMLLRAKLQTRTSDFRGPQIVNINKFEVRFQWLLFTLGSI